MAHQPILILTKRRTCGTSIATFLNRLTASGRMEFEPFNIKKPLGSNALKVAENGEAETLRALVVDFLENCPHVKHCFDNVNDDITATVIRAAVERNYRVLVLTRRDNAKRVMSLAVAGATGAWDHVSAARIYPMIRSGQVSPAAIDPSQIRTMVRMDLRRTGRVLSQLRHLGVDYKWLLHEDLFQADGPSLECARDLAAWAGSALAEDDPNLSFFSSDRRQNSAAIGDKIPGFEQAKTMARMLCDY